MKNLARGLKKNVIAQDFINFKTEERSARLGGLIVRELIDTHSEQSKTRRNVSWLSRLGYEDRAREAYLEARSDLIQRRSRYVFGGRSGGYLAELAECLTSRLIPT